MTLDALKNAKKVIGIKQVTKAVQKGTAARVFLAADADERVIRPLRELCEKKQIVFDQEATMMEIGSACSIEVGAAAAAALC